MLRHCASIRVGFPVTNRLSVVKFGATQNYTQIFNCEGVSVLLMPESFMGQL